MKKVKDIVETELQIHERNKELVPENKLKGHINSVECIEFNPNDNSKLVSGSHDHTMRIWDLNKMKEIRSVQPHR